MSEKWTHLAYLMLACVLTFGAASAGKLIGKWEGRAEMKKLDEAECKAHPVVREVPITVLRHEFSEENGKAISRMWVEGVDGKPDCLVDRQPPAPAPKPSNRHKRIGVVGDLGDNLPDGDCTSNEFGMTCQYPLRCRDPKPGSEILKGDACLKDIQPAQPEKESKPQPDKQEFPPLVGHAWFNPDYMQRPATGHYRTICRATNGNDERIATVPEGQNPPEGFTCLYIPAQP